MYWRRIRGFVPVLIVGIVGVFATLSVWYMAVGAENAAFEREFVSRADNQATILQGGINDYWEKLYAVRAFFESSDRPVARAEFESFSKSLLDAQAAILNIAWAPRVKRGDRAAHEQAAARDGLSDYHIRYVGPDGFLSTSPERDEYFPKFYSTEARTSSVYGLDLNDNGMWTLTLDRSRDGNALATSPPLVLLIGEGDRRGFFATLPVYERGSPIESVEDRRANLAGFVQGVFQIGVMLDTKLAAVTTPVHLYLFAPEASVRDMPVYFSSRFGTGAIEAKSQASLAAELHRSTPIKFGDVDWTLVVTPESAGLISAGHKRSTVLLASGLLLTGGLIWLVGAMRHYSSKIEFARDRTEKQNLRFDAALNNMGLGLLMYDPDGHLVISNRRFAKLFRVPWDKWEVSALGKTVPQAMQLAATMSGITEMHRPQVIAEHAGVLERGRAGKVIVERTDGNTFSAVYAPMSDGGFVVTFEDVTEQRRNEETILHMAHYDALTDLPNRVLFYEKMNEMLTLGPRNGAFAVLSLDLDRFKSVNDSLGHPIGDGLLRAVAGRMRSAIRDADFVARLGGDEFAILQGRIAKPEDATMLAERVIDAVSAPYELNGHQIVVGISIGIAITPDDGVSPDELMKNADLALYRCKADGGNMYRFFEVQMDARMQERRALEFDLRKALINDEFLLEYQPIVNLKTGRVSSCEALIRWHQPQRGILPPGVFIPIAEETGLIVPMGEWALRRACADAAHWPAEFLVSVNVSAGQFRGANFAHVVEAALQASGLPARRLELEITESVLMQENDGVLAVLHQIKDLGVSIAMDDFGTGYSSLGYLRSFPFDRIKIDRSFVRDLSDDKDSLAILRAVVGLGRSLNIVTTAEGVETQKQLEVLKSEGCNDAQGFLFSRPRPAGEVKALLAAFDGKAKAMADAAA